MLKVGQCKKLVVWLINPYIFTLHVICSYCLFRSHLAMNAQALSARPLRTTPTWSKVDLLFDSLVSLFETYLLVTHAYKIHIRCDPLIFLYIHQPPQKKTKTQTPSNSVTPSVNSSPSHKSPNIISQSLSLPKKSSPKGRSKSPPKQPPSEADADYPPEATTPEKAPNPPVPVQTAPPVAPPAKHVTKATVPVVPVAMLGLTGGGVDLLTLLTLTLRKGGGACIQWSGCSSTIARCWFAAIFVWIT